MIKLLCRLAALLVAANPTVQAYPLVQAYPDPGPCSGACWAHDPSIIQRSSDGLYFKFNTGGGIEISTSRFLAGPWTWQEYTLPNGSSIHINGGTDLWAPDVHKIGNTYYMYYAVSSFGSQISSIGLATSKTMDIGSWRDHGAIGVSSTSANPYNAIDPNLIHVGKDYLLNFGSFWNDIYQVKLDSAATNASSEGAYQLAYNSTGLNAEEGSFMFRHGRYYYLLWSSGICCGYEDSKPAPGEEYKIMMCRSTFATRDFVDKKSVKCTSSGGSPLLESHGTTYGPGGQGVFSDAKLGLILYYHYAKTTVGLGDASYLNWRDGWPYVQ